MADLTGDAATRTITERLMMIRKIISRQKAVAICKQERLDFQQIKTHGPLLLKTGAKLGFTATGQYVIAGYAYDGSDVTYYERKR